jgi:carboxyl-terminal processing protease
VTYTRTVKAKWNILAATILASSLLLGVLAAPTSSGPNSPAQTLFEQASFYLKFHYHGFSSVNLEILVAKYKRELDRACSGLGEKCAYEVARPVLSKMLGEVKDGHTYYISPEAYAENLASEQGSNGPSDKPLIGWQLEGTVGGVLVAELIAGGPAQLAGMHRFDKIIGINGRRFTNGQNGIQQIRATSASNQATRFEIARGQARFEVTLTPRILEETDLLPYLEDSGAPAVMLLRIPSFETYEKTGMKVHELVNQAILRNTTGIIVDLRDNPGGFLTECVAAAGAFVGNFSQIFESRFESTTDGYKDGTVEDNDPIEPQSYSISNPAKFSGKVVTLVNSSTASCGEEFAYRMQLQKRGPVIGEPTYGILNTATNDFVLIDRSALAITTVRALEANGKPFPERVTPDIRLVDNFLEIGRNGTDVLVERALELLR